MKLSSLPSSSLNSSHQPSRRVDVGLGHPQRWVLRVRRPPACTGRRRRRTGRSAAADTARAAERSRAEGHGRRRARRSSRRCRRRRPTRTVGLGDPAHVAEAGGAGVAGPGVDPGQVDGHERQSSDLAGPARRGCRRRLGCPGAGFSSGGWRPAGRRGAGGRSQEQRPEADGGGAAGARESRDRQPARHLRCLDHERAAAAARLRGERGARRGRHRRGVDRGARDARTPGPLRAGAQDPRLDLRARTAAGPLRSGAGRPAGRRRDRLPTAGHALHGPGEDGCRGSCRARLRDRRGRRVARCQRSGWTFPASAPPRTS